MVGRSRSRRGPADRDHPQGASGQFSGGTKRAQGWPPRRLLPSDCSCGLWACRPRPLLSLLVTDLMDKHGQRGRGTHNARACCILSYPGPASITCDDTCHCSTKPGLCDFGRCFPDRLRLMLLNHEGGAEAAGRAAAASAVAGHPQVTDALALPEERFRDAGHRMNTVRSSSVLLRTSCSGARPVS
jgi:hypothetical protein